MGKSLRLLGTASQSVGESLPSNGGEIPYVDRLGYLEEERRSPRVS